MVPVGWLWYLAQEPLRFAQCISSHAQSARVLTWVAVEGPAGYVSMDLAGIAGWVFSLLTGSVLLTWLFNRSRGSLLVVALFHTTIDIVFTCDAATPAAVGVMGALITVWGIETVVIMKPLDLARVGRMREVDG